MPTYKSYVKSLYGEPWWPRSLAPMICSILRKAADKVGLALEYDTSLLRQPHVPTCATNSSQPNMLHLAFVSREYFLGASSISCAPISLSDYI